MCAGDGGSPLRDTLFSRGDFLSVAGATMTPLAGGSNDEGIGDVGRYPLSPVPAALSVGNALAAALAARSPLAQSTFARVAALAASIGDAELRESVVALLHDPRPRYARAYQTDRDRLALRDALAAAGFVTADAPVTGIFPPGTQADTGVAVQPFWSTPGSSNGSHHAYPGGLAVHEYFNASMAQAFARTYDHHYFSDTATVDRDTVVGAALYHDICKTVVFGWNADGSLFDELTIAGTGAHHILSGAEAIVRGRTPRFVTTLLSAHAAPSLGDEAKVAAWCRAAALVAGVDPVEFGVLTRAGELSAQPAPLEAFISHLSDHDYVLSIAAMQSVGARLQSRFTASANRPAPPPPYATFAWYRSAILTRTSAIALYDLLGRSGGAGFDAAVSRAEIDLWPA